MKILTIKKYIYWAIRTGKFIYCVHSHKRIRSPGSAGFARRTAGQRGWHRRKQHAPHSATSIHGVGSFALKGHVFNLAWGILRAGDVFSRKGMGLGGCRVDPMGPEEL